jgi:two-component system response regulator
MLILERSVDKPVCIGRDVKVHVVEVINKRRVKLGVEAPADVPVWRAEMGEWRGDAPSLACERFRILVIEDDLAQGKIITRTLATSTTAEVTLVKTGREVHEICGSIERGESQVPDLVLMDYRLPDARGDELVAHIRGLSPLRTVPIVMLSCADSAHEVSGCLSAGANAFISKAEGYDEFRTSVLRIVDFWSHARRVA